MKNKLSLNSAIQQMDGREMQTDFQCVNAEERDRERERKKEKDI